MNEDNQKNHIYVAVQFHYPQNQRQISAAIVNQDKRSITLSEFSDEEHFSNFESLLLQTNLGSNDEKYTLYIQYPDLSSEQEKIQDIIQTAGIQVVEKTKKDFKEVGFEQDLNKLLGKPLTQHVIESQMTKSLVTLSSIVLGLKLHQEETNFKQFTLQQHVLSQFMKLDLAAINALLILPKQNEVKNLNNTGHFATLLDLLDKCKTSIGSRTLKRWLKQPLQSSDEINRRLQLVEMFINMDSLTKHLCDDFLKKVADLDKLYAKFYRVHSQKPKHGANITDIIKVYQLVKSIKDLNGFIETSEFNTDPTYGELITQQILEPLQDIENNFQKCSDMIEQGIDLDKASNEREYVVSEKFSETLKETNKKILKSKKQIDRITEQVNDDLGINVRLIDSNAQTYVFEAKKKEADDAFRKKNAKKYKTLSVKKAQITFTTAELQAEIVELVSLKEDYQNESKQVIDKLLTIVSTYYSVMEEASNIISEIDVLSSFANLSTASNYVKPTINDEVTKIKLIESKHACLDANDSGCISNSCVMDKENSRFHIITGPNMGGKSTYIRQVAICVLLAHIGCYIPAEEAEIPIIDAIITRVGASDMQLRGISTFMSEMLEASCMIKIATQNSLIIIDELGRGTSTSEGFGLAWAISDYIVNNIGCYCLFATHFHEMIKMEDQVKGVKNYHVTCQTANNKLTMQYKVKKGFAERSYGLYVAELLNFPKSIISDAHQKLSQLENFQQNDSDSNNGMEEETQINENINLANVDLQDISKKATGQQKEKIIRLAHSYTDKLKQAENPEEVMNELKQKVVSILIQ